MIDYFTIDDLVIFAVKIGREFFKDALLASYNWEKWLISKEICC